MDFVLEDNLHIMFSYHTISNQLLHTMTVPILDLLQPADVDIISINALRPAASDPVQVSWTNLGGIA